MGFSGALLGTLKTIKVSTRYDKMNICVYTTKKI